MEPTLTSQLLFPYPLEVTGGSNLSELSEPVRRRLFPSPLGVNGGSYQADKLSGLNLANQFPSPREVIEGSNGTTYYFS